MPLKVALLLYQGKLSVLAEEKLNIRLGSLTRAQIGSSDRVVTQISYFIKWYSYIESKLWKHGNFSILKEPKSTV